MQQVYILPCRSLFKHDMTCLFNRVLSSQSFSILKFENQLIFINTTTQLEGRNESSDTLQYRND